MLLLGCVISSSSFSGFPAISLKFTIFGEIFAYVTIFSPTIEVVTFCLRGWCMLGVFLLSFHPSRTWMSGSFQSVRWSACVHRLDMCLYSHLKEFLGNGARNRVNLKKKSALLEAQRGFDPTTLHHAGQRAQHTINWAIPAPQQCYLNRLMT